MVIATHSINVDTHFRADEDNVDGTVHTLAEPDVKKADHPEWLPTWDKSQKFPKLQPFKHVDRGFFGDPGYERLLAEATGKVEQVDITPKLGTEIRSGIQLTKLSPEAKDDLALLVERRGIVIFRNQDFKDQTPEFAKQWGSHFGPLHIHQTSGAPLNHPEFHITFRRSNPDEFQKTFARRLSNITFHSDVSYELQPPGVTLFCVLQGPPSGGDTLFADTIEAYDRLSDKMKVLLDGLQVVHSSVDQATDSLTKGGILRRDEVEHVHPLVRYHPVLKKKLLYVHSNFARRIIGLKDEESDVLLKFLINHIESALDLQLHARYEPGTVVLWDNRRVLHSATTNWENPVIRHAFRITPQAERPVASEEEYENWTPEKELEDLKKVQKVLAADPNDANRL
ncbi:unnamed protein product [Kuraishia capsulata CBS 1993]|uniref:TauD/TfdA-like domain-containing protein n=1 Tax=Kuraishia capsulata CBS 1993 TaxID=1382522 RepID=W6MT97_9ASCO|nr:uncharacterized protein KUCA_T00005616001 [Kuraishia capsulata CBS 1993]CDK29623.1 unnamed protein product [Kuraishia capsulata CBS 1993]